MNRSINTWTALVALIFSFCADAAAKSEQPTSISVGSPFRAAVGLLESEKSEDVTEKISYSAEVTAPENMRRVFRLRSGEVVQVYVHAAVPDQPIYQIVVATSRLVPWPQDLPAGRTRVRFDSDWKLVEAIDVSKE